MNPPKPEKSREQIAAERRAKRDHETAVQSDLQAKTSYYGRLVSPRVSLATGRRLNSPSMVR